MVKLVKDRPRRLRRNALIRDLVHEVDLRMSQLIQPYFLAEGANATKPITGFTEVYRWGVDRLSKRIEGDLEKGVKSFLLFGGGVKKDEKGKRAFDPNGMVPKALRALKKRFGEVFCFSPISAFALIRLTGIAVFSRIMRSPMMPRCRCSRNPRSVFAEAGADFVAPSDMMDGRVGVIRDALDEKGLSETGILAYTAKYASSYYGPFREALDSSPEEGDRSSYQMDFRNRTDAARDFASISPKEPTS